MTGPTNILWYSSVAVQLFFCAHLLWTRLAKKHPVFTAYLACSVLRSLVAMHYPVLEDGSLPVSYTYFWLWTEPVLLLLQIGLALEVHAALWSDHRAVARSARPLLIFSLLTALVFAALPLSVELRRFSLARLEVVMQFEFLAKRYISTVLAIFLILSALLFLIVVRNSLRSSLLRHETMLAGYFAIYAVAYFIVNMGWTRIARLNNYMLSALTLCLVLWISIFKPAGPLAKSPPAPNRA
jgi:hypothetical protein